MTATRTTRHWKRKTTSNYNVSYTVAQLKSTASIISDFGTVHLYLRPETQDGTSIERKTSTKWTGQRNSTQHNCAGDYDFFNLGLSF